MSYDKKMMIVEIVGETFGVKNDYYKKKSRKRSYVYPRKALCMLMREFAAFSLMEVAEFFGKKEHTTVLHHINDGTHMLDYDDSFRMSYEKARRRIQTLCND